MNPPRIERRILVVGAPRSGTTLVQSLLAAHSRMTSFTESHFFARHFAFVPGLPRPILTRDPRARVRAFLAENGVDEDTIDEVLQRLARSVPPRPLLPLGTRAVARRLLWVLDEMTRERGRRGWVEKTPRHLRYIDWLENLLERDDGTYFVHVLRDGLEVVASLRDASRQWERPYDLATCVARWNEDVALSLGRLGRPRDRFVFYEELTTRPEATLERLFASLHLDWQPEVLERFGKVSNRLVTREETWKEGVGRRLRPSATSERALGRAERERARATLQFDRYEQLLTRAAGTNRVADD